MRTSLRDRRTSDALLHPRPREPRKEAAAARQDRHARRGLRRALARRPHRAPAASTAGPCPPAIGQFISACHAWYLPSGMTWVAAYAGRAGQVWIAQKTDAGGN